MVDEPWGSLGVHPVAPCGALAVYDAGEGIVRWLRADSGPLVSVESSLEWLVVRTPLEVFGDRDHGVIDLPAPSGPARIVFQRSEVWPDLVLLGFCFARVDPDRVLEDLRRELSRAEAESLGTGAP